MKKYLVIKDNIFKNTILLNLKLLILITPLAIYKYVDRFRANQEAWLKLFVIIGITLWALKCLKDNKIIWKKSEINLYIFLFILVMSISLLISDYTVVSIKEYLIFLSYFFIYFLIINNIENKRQFYSFIRLFFITSFVISIYTLLHYYGFISYLKEFGPVMSVIGQKNWISNYLVMVFPIIFFRFLLEKAKRNKIIYFILLSVLYINLMICQSRGIWISIFLTFPIALYSIFKFKFLEIFRENKGWLMILLSTFLIITVIYSTDNPLNKSTITVPERALSILDEEDTSINTRLLILNATFEMIKDKPILGSGIGTFKMNYLFYQAEFLKNNPYFVKHSGNAKEAHNDYLQIAAELGIAGFGIFVSIILFFYSLFINYLKNESNDKNKIIVFSLFMGITCFLIHSIFTFPLHVPALGSAFFIILGLTLVYIKDFHFSKFGKFKSKDNNITKSQNLRLNVLLTILIMLIMILAIDSFVLRPYLAEAYAYKGKKNSVLAKYNNALYNFEYATKLDPYNGRILVSLGAIYYNLGFFNKSEKTLQQSKKYYNDRNIYENLGICYMKLKRFQEAEEELKHAIYLDPKFTKAYFDLGLLYFKEENYEKTIEQWNKILEIEPNFPNKYIVLNNLGIVYQKKEMLDKALEYFVQALQFAPDGSSIIEEIEEEIYNIYKGKLNS